MSLNSAIRGYVEDIVVNHPLDIHLDLPDDENAFDAALPEDIGLTLFRVLQEGLVNILRHASASQVRVKLTFDTAWASLEIQDDGCGFEMPPRLGQFIRQQHFGLAGLQERLDLVGGRLEVSSAPGKGTTCGRVCLIAFLLLRCPL